MKPITRKELYLNKIVGNNDYEIPEKPITTEEFFFAEILGEAVQAPEPLTRYQMYLAKIAGREIEIPYPEVRLEYFLARAAGMDVETPVPITREEIYWSNYTSIVDFEVEGVPPLTYKAIEGTLENYRIYGNTVNGENVGDLITEGEHAGEYKVPVTVEGKNLLQNTASSQIVNGVTYTVNSDGSVTCNGQATSLSLYKIRIYLHASTSYILNGCPSGGSIESYSADLRYNDLTVSLRDIGNGVNYTCTQTGIYVYGIRIAWGYTCNNLTFYPMIRKADIEDDTYEPYQPPVTTPIYLPEQIKKVGDEAEYIDYAEQKQHRVRKNLVQTIATSQTINDITFTVNANGSVTCNGTNYGNNPIMFELNNPDVVFPEGVYITSGCPAGGSITGGYKIQYFNGSGWNYELGSGSTFTLSGNLKYRSRILISKDVTVTNLTFYPMLRLASIEDDTYEPYIEDTELDVTLPALPTLSGTNILTVGTEVKPSKVYIKGEKEREYG